MVMLGGLLPSRTPRVGARPPGGLKPRRLPAELSVAGLPASGTGGGGGGRDGRHFMYGT